MRKPDNLAQMPKFREAGVLVDAGGVVGAAAVAEGDLAALEVAGELVPFLVGGDPVFGGRAQGPAAGDERPVAGDDFVGVDGLVAQGDVDVAVPGDQLRDVRRHPVHDRVGDEQPAEIVEGVAQRGAAGGGDADGGQRVVEVANRRGDQLASGRAPAPAAAGTEDSLAQAGRSPFAADPRPGDDSSTVGRSYRRRRGVHGPGVVAGVATPDRRT